MIITIVVNNTNDIKRVKNLDLVGNPFITILDEKSKKDKSEAYKLKNTWAARLSPFILMQDNQQIKAFYSEASSDVINDLKIYLNESRN